MITISCIYSHGQESFLLKKKEIKKQTKKFNSFSEQDNLDYIQLLKSVL